MTQIVGINGFKRAGKGEVASALSRLHDGFVYEIGFADKLKILGAKILGVSTAPRDDIVLMDQFKLEGLVDSYMTGHDGMESDHVVITGRQFLQNLGNEARNVLGDTLWIDLVLPRPRWDNPGDARMALEGRYPDVDVVAITDLRYENEAQRIRDLGGVVWEVVRPGLSSDGHASEQPLPRHLVDEQIVNDGDLDALEQKVCVAMVNTLC